MLDEAYYEYVTGLQSPEAMELLRRYPNFAVLRTFSKAYGLASLRIGYVMAHPHVINAVDQVLVPFAVNGLAQAAALSSLGRRRAAARVAAIAERRGCRASSAAVGFSTPDPRPTSCGSRPVRRRRPSPWRWSRRAS